MQYVFQAADLSKYDHDAAMSKYGFIDWGVNTTLNIGDVVFLYFKTPVQKIRYKTVVEKIIFKATDICGDEFWKDGNKRKEKDKYYRLKLVDSIDDERLSYGYLKEHGVISTLQGSEEVKPETLKYIESVLYVKNSFEREEKDIDEIFNNENLQETEREVLAKARIGQGVFRERLIQRDGCCRICGIRNKELLKASHIKPWKNCKNSNEKLNEANGLLLCAIHDALFDRGLICFDKEGHIIISDDLSDGDRKILGLDNEIQLSMSDEMKSFMSWRLNSLLDDVDIVYHCELGKGTIISRKNNEITVRFYKGNKEILKTYMADAAFKKGTLKRHI